MNDKDGPELHFSTGNLQVDDILQGIVGIYEMTFPDRIKAYYLTGSYAYGDPVSTSDIDLNIVFRDEDELTGTEDQREDFGMLIFKTLPPTKEERKFHHITRHLRLMSPIELGIAFRTEKDIRRRFVPDVRAINVFLFGEDLLEELATLPPSGDTFSPRGGMHIAYNNLCRIYALSDVFELPIRHPAPEEEFYGYAREEMHSYGLPLHSMGDFFNAVFFPVSTALIALKAGISIGRKDKIAQTYRSCINDEWTSLIEDAFNLCRSTWHYLIPEDEQDRQKLQEICVKALAFSDYFLTMYRDFVLNELQSTDRSGVLMSAMTMKKTFFKDPEIEVALKNHQYSTDKEVRQTIEDIFQKSSKPKKKR